MNEDRSSIPTRDTILSAAANIVLEQGASRMTLEAVAKEAGVSKGGCFTTSQARMLLSRA